MLLSCKNSLCILVISLLSDIYFANVLLSRLPFRFVDGFLCCAEVFSFTLVLLIYFSFVAFAFIVRVKNITETYVKELTTMFSPRTFIETGFTFKPLIHFELIFVYKIVIQVYSFICSCPVFPASFKRLYFPLLYARVYCWVPSFYASYHDSV